MEKKYAYINPEMLKWAREQTPFNSVEDVQLKLRDIKPEYLRAWEEGMEFPSISEAKKLASLYKIPFAAFYFSKKPSGNVKNYIDRRTKKGTVYGENSYELWAEIKRVIEDREKLVEISENEIYNFQKIPKVQNDDIEFIANKIREFLEIDGYFKYKANYDYKPFNYFRQKFEDKGIMISQISSVDICEMKGLSIFYEEIPIIAINNKDWETAKVFSLFHEMAHLVRRSSSLCLIDFDERNDEEEKICDKIAAETLLPRMKFIETVKEIREKYVDWDEICLGKIADKFAVSKVTVLRRLYELGIIEYDYYREKYEEMILDFESNKKKNKNKNNPIQYYIRYLNQHGYLFPKIILQNHFNGKISYGKMCNILNIKPRHITDIEQAVMFR